MTVSENVINATSRSETGSAASRRLRKLDFRIPAIVYGLKTENLKITIDTKEWITFAKKDIQVIKLMIDEKKPINVLLKDIQYNVLSDTTLHVDLQEIDMKEEITATIPVYSHGTAAGIAQGGILTQLEHEIEVSCLPNDLPESIEVDITELEMDGSILVKELVVPENVKITSDPEMLVLQVAQPKVQEEETDTEDEAEGEVRAEGEAGPEGETGAEESKE
jgi:large subunit ribosomal protein L25